MLLTDDTTLREHLVTRRLVLPAPNLTGPKGNENVVSMILELRNLSCAPAGYGRLETEVRTLRMVDPTTPAWCVQVAGVKLASAVLVPRPHLPARPRVGRANRTLSEHLHVYETRETLW